MKKLLLLLAFCGTAQAATETLTINGTVASTCVFSSPVNGVFGYEVQTPNVLDTQLTGGLDAGVVINYNGTPTVTIDEITTFATVPSGFTDTVSFTNTLTTTNGSRTYSNGTASWVESGSTTTDALTLRLRAVNAQGSFPIGNYSASTTVTCQ